MPASGCAGVWTIEWQADFEVGSRHAFSSHTGNCAIADEGHRLHCGGTLTVHVEDDGEIYSPYN